MSETSNTGAPAPEAAATPAAETPETENEAVEQEGAEQAAEGEAAPEAASKTAKEVKKLEKQLKKFKLKVDGQEIEEELDLADEEQVKKHLQFSKAAQKRMAETAELRKSAEEFIKLLKTNPRRILEDPAIGIDLKKFASDIINEQLEEEKKSPEQKEREKLQKELEDLRSKAKREEEARKQAEFERLQEEAFTRIDTDITEALKEANLPKKPYVLKKFAELMSTALDNDIELSAKDVAPLVRKQIIEDIQEMAGAAPEDVIEEIIGKDVIAKLRKKNLAKAKVVPSANNVKPTTASAKPAEPKEKSKIPLKDFLKTMK